MGFGRLERTPSAQPMSEINMTPLVDVMLVLVAILIVTTPLLASAIRLDLPRAAASASASGGVHLNVAIDQAGQLYFNDQAVNTEELSARLLTAAQRAPETEVQLRADETIAYGKVVEVMGIAQQAGLSRIGFVAQTSKKSN